MQPINMITTSKNMHKSDHRNNYQELLTHPFDITSGDATQIIATVPFLPAGEYFMNIPANMVGVCQQFGINETLPGTMLTHMGTSRKVGVSGNTQCMGSMTRLQIHGNSLVTALYRSTFYYILEHPELQHILNRLFTTGAEPEWIKGINSNGFNPFSSDLSSHLDKVIATGSLTSMLFKFPFGLIIVKKDQKQRVTDIKFLEQCHIRGQNEGVSAGAFQMYDSLTFEFERVRPLTCFNNYSLSKQEAVGLHFAT